MGNEINLSSVAPGAPAGNVNLTWQSDASTPPNVSAYAPKVPVSLFTKTTYTTAQRALGTVYQNTTGKPLIVSGWHLDSTNLMTAVCDSNPAPSTVVNEQLATTGYGMSFLFIVPNNYYYEISGTGLTAEAWVEWTINSGTVAFSGELSGSRALSTVYQNTSGFAKLVVTDLSGVGANTAISGISDSGSSPSAVVWLSQVPVGAANAGRHTAYMLVPNNHYYKFTTSGTGTVQHWNEYTMPFQAVKSTDYAVAPALRVQGKGTGVGVPSWLNLTGKDLFVMVSDNPTGTSTLSGGASTGFAVTLATTPASFPQSSMANTSAQKDCVPIFVLPTETYYAAHDGSTSYTLNHWWEYTLG